MEEYRKVLRVQKIDQSRAFGKQIEKLESNRRGTRDRRKSANVRSKDHMYM